MEFIVKKHKNGKNWDVFFIDGTEEKLAYGNIANKRTAEKWAAQENYELEMRLRKERALNEARQARRRATDNYRNTKKRLEMVVNEETALLFIATKMLSGLTHEEFMRQMLNLWLDQGQKSKTDSSQDELLEPEQPKQGKKHHQKQKQP